MPPPAMEPQPIIGVNMSEMQAQLQRDGWDPQTQELGWNMVLYFVYNTVPDPPISTAAPHSLAGAAWLPGGVDRISSLPDQILRDIVSRLPAKDAARTAALASCWRPLWRSVPLTVVDSHFLPDGGAFGALPIHLQYPTDVTPAVSRALAAHPGPFRCVHLTCTAMDAHRGEIGRWLEVLAAKGVQELTFINRPWPIDLRLPATLFSCASLTRLHIGVWRLPDTAAVPRAATFPHLRELGLCFFVGEDRDLAFLLDRSPVLEILTIMSSQTGVRLRFVSHSLRCVQLCYSYVTEIAVVDAPRLERLLQSTTWGHGSEGNKCSTVKIGHAPNLRIVGFLQPGMHALEIGNTVILAETKASPSTIVSTVKTLAIEVQFGVRNEVRKVPSFLRCFPNVESLHVYSGKDDKPTGKVNLKFWQEGGPINCVLSCMKKVVFDEFRGSRSEIAFLKFVAENARVLEKMVIVVAYKCYSSGDDVHAKLKPLTCAKWASEACELRVFKSQLTEGGGPVYSIKLAFTHPNPFDLGHYHDLL